MADLFKNLLDQHDITQTSIAKHLKCSSAQVNLIVKHGIYPKKKAQHIYEQILSFLQNSGIPKEQILNVLKPVPQSKTLVDSHTEQNIEEQTMIRRQTLTQETKRKFRLTQNIFTCELNSADQLFINDDINYARESMYQTAKGNSSFIAVISDSGAGKTTAKIDMKDRIERQRDRIIVIEPYVLATESDDIKGKTLKSAHIADAIINALAPNSNVKRSIEARFRQAHNLLIESERAGYKHVLVIDEAHSLPIPTLKHLKRFTELKNGYSQLITVILLGQSELKNKLSETNPEVREVVQRCEIITLNPLEPSSVHAYLQKRCDTVNRKLSDFIDVSGIDAICQKLTVNHGSQGQRSMLYPLAIGNLITGALNAATECHEDIITADLIMEV